MIHANDKVIRHKVSLFNLAEELGSVFKAYQVTGLHRLIELPKVVMCARLVGIFMRFYLAFELKSFLIRNSHSKTNSFSLI